MKRRYALALLCLASPLAAAQDSPLRPLRRMLPTLPAVEEVAFGDWDGDGDPDAVALSRSELRTLRNDGNGRYRPTGLSLSSPDGQPFSAMALGDSDGDGDLDLFTATEAGLHLFLNAGSGAFVLSTVFFEPIFGTPYFSTIRLADLNDDGNLDVFVVRALYLADGMGGFVRQPGLLFGNDAVLVDVDGDDDLDILGIGVMGPPPFFHNVAYGYRNDGSLGFAWLGTFGGSPNTIAVGDLDGDGDADALLGRALFENDGLGNFQYVEGALPAGGQPHFSELADVDGDADLDVYLVAFADSSYQEFAQELLINDGHGVFSASAGLPYRTVQPFYRQASLATEPFDDLDVDERVDLAVGQRLFFGNGAGDFHGDRAQPPLPSTFGRGFDLADVDGDEDLDALGANALLLNDGTGILTLVRDRLPPADDLNVTSVELGDVDGDGDPDALLTGARTTLYANRDGTFVDVTTGHAPAENGPGLEVVLGDLDGDGDLDAAFANGSYLPDPQLSARNALWINDGKGLFVDRPALPAVAEVSLSVALADIDGDGDADVVIGNKEANRLYRNDAEARRFTDVSQHLQSSVDATLALSFGDLNHDGDLDLVTNDSRKIRSHENDGAGRFTETSAFPPDVFSPYRHDLELLDVEGDGDLDVVASRPRDEAPLTLLYTNEGEGEWGPGVLLGSGARVLAAGDLDGDGDLDLLTENDVLTNVTRALVWGSRPRIGRPLELELYGPAQGEWWLFGASRPAFARTPFGSLRLGPDAILYRRRGQLDDEGRATVRFRVPDDASVVGTTVFWQAYLAGRLTNFERTTFAAF